MKRLKKGAYKAMSPEAQKARKHALQKAWRDRHPERIKEINHKWAVYYQRTRPFKCICQSCGKEFGAPRNYFVTCQDCVRMHKEIANARRKAREARIEAKTKRNAEIIRLHKKGLLQREIAQKVGICQCGVSYVLRSFGYRTLTTKRTRNA